MNMTTLLRSRLNTRRLVVVALVLAGLAALAWETDQPLTDEQIDYRVRSLKAQQMALQASVIQGYMDCAWMATASSDESIGPRCRESQATADALITKRIGKLQEKINALEAQR
jgi:hypothetical protein